MATISFMSDTVRKLFELFHLPKETREAHIHFKVHEAVTIDATYFMTEPTNEEIENVKTVSKTFELKEVKKEKEKKVKEIFAKGLFIRKDKYGLDCCVGDLVCVTCPEFTIEKLDKDPIVYEINPIPVFRKQNKIFIEAHTYEGQLLLLKSKGVIIKTSTGYITPKLTDKARNPWVWEKMHPII
jgi:hypothetical protein